MQLLTKALCTRKASLSQDKVLGRGGIHGGGGGQYRVAGLCLSLENVVTGFYFPQ